MVVRRVLTKMMRMRSAWQAAVLLLMLAATTTSIMAQSSGRYDHYEVYDRDLLPLREYAERRERVLDQLKNRTAMLVRAADLKVRSNDVEYEFRQRNNLLYLTGVTEQESALLLIPDGMTVNGKRTREILFVLKRSPARETWTGIRMGVEVAPSLTGINTVLSADRLPGILDTLLPTLDSLYYDDWLLEKETEPLADYEVSSKRVVSGLLAEKYPKLRILHAGTILNDMRTIKSREELILLKKAIAISMEAHRETMRKAQPGMHEYEFEAIMEYTFRKLGAEDPGYPSIVGSGPNTCILHYSTNRRRSKPGELVLMDCGAEYHGYSADITRTFPVDGTFTPEQKAIYNLVLEANDAGIAACTSGNNFWEPHVVVKHVLAHGLMKLGIITDTLAVDTYFMHGTSHYLGMDVHDVGSYGKLQPGTVLTVEPGIYISEGSNCDPKWWNIGIRIEDNVLVTEGEPVNLTAGLERTAEQIERLMAEAP